MKQLLLVLLLAPSLSFAQDEDSKPESPFSHYRWEIGINGGVNITNVAGLADSLTTASRFGKLYGLTLTYHFNRWLALKTDFDFENKGWTVNDIDILAPDGISLTNQDVNQYLLSLIHI